MLLALFWHEFGGRAAAHFQITDQLKPLGLKTCCESEGTETGTTVVLPLNIHLHVVSPVGSFVKPGL